LVAIALAHHYLKGAVYFDFAKLFVTSEFLAARSVVAWVGVESWGQCSDAYVGLVAIRIYMHFQFGTVVIQDYCFIVVILSRRAVIIIRGGAVEAGKLAFAGEAGAVSLVVAGAAAISKVFVLKALYEKWRQAVGFVQGQVQRQAQLLTTVGRVFAQRNALVKRDGRVLLGNVVENGLLRREAGRVLGAAPGKVLFFDVGGHAAVGGG
jgi:hypothetical protein